MQTMKNKRETYPRVKYNVDLHESEGYVTYVDHWFCSWFTSYFLSGIYCEQMNSVKVVRVVKISYLTFFFKS